MKNYIKNGKIIPMNFKLGDIFEFKLNHCKKTIGIVVRKSSENLWFETPLKRHNRGEVKFEFTYVGRFDVFEEFEVLGNLFDITQSVKLKTLPQYFEEC
jgi:hypothetical protein